MASLLVAFLTAVAWGLSHVFSGRAMYMQIGAMLGTMMAANVLFVIIPAQRKLVEAKERGEAPDPVYGLRGKQRSVHNNYFTLPVLLTMISNHYPMTFGHPHAWLVLACLLLLAAYVRHFFNLRHRGRTAWAIPLTAAVGALALAIAIAPARPAPNGAVALRDVQPIIAARCATCHAEHPRWEGIASRRRAWCSKRRRRSSRRRRRSAQQAVASRAMPLGNVTQMTDDERARLAAWIDAGARAD